ncbi:MAG TPA: hypothetical protein VEY88_26410 [Archangium sp.]|nr:hypothetical protein [Archangium sp.]HZH79582.1 hypothetical protein [Archangium sp.]
MADEKKKVQGAVMAASAGAVAAAMMNHALNVENAGAGTPPGH